MEKYIVTDPCYILSEEVWSDCCYQCDKECKDENNWSDHMSKIVEKALEKHTGKKAYVSKTGYGDWSNTLFGPNILASSFGADAGMVCVCAYTDKIKEKLDEYPNPYLGAIFESESPIKVNFNKEHPSWIVVEITNENGQYWHSITA